MDFKTPVTLLQELCAKRRCTPEFTLFDDVVDTGKPSFVCHVSALGKNAIGKGNSKKVAKHAAAEALLDTLKDMNTSESLPVNEIMCNPYSDEMRENAVGALQNFCLTYMINIPRYEDVSQEGLPHARYFHVKCLIPPHTTEGTGRTKKQAKHVAAYIMLGKLKELVTPVSKREIQEKQNKAIERLCEQLEKDVKLPTNQRPQYFVDGDFDKLFKDKRFFRSEKFIALKCKDEVSVINLRNPIEFFENLMTELNLSWKRITIATIKGCHEEIKCLRVTDFRNVTFFGHGENELLAFKDAVRKALCWFATMGK